MAAWTIPWRLVVAGSLVLLSAALLGCDTFPADANHTYQTIEQGGVLHVGVSHSPPWVHVEDGHYGGVEVELVEELSRQMDVELEWHHLSQERIIHALRHGQVHLGIAGFTQKSPWQDRAGFTLAYVTESNERHVMLVRSGENRWLMYLDHFLAERDAEIRRRLEHFDSPGGGR